MNGLPYYKRYPRDFVEGTIGLPFEIKTTYSFVLDLIYMQGGELPDDPRYISGLLGVSIRKWKSLRKALIEFGKIQVSGKYLTNYRAVSELETLTKLQDKQRENRSRPNKNKDLQSPPINHTEPDTDIRKKEEERGATEAAPATVLNGSKTNGYAFSGKIIKLNKLDFETWQTNYYGIPDLRAELTSMDDYYDGELQGKDRLGWFRRCSSVLSKRHQAMIKAKRELADVRRSGTMGP